MRIVGHRDYRYIDAHETYRHREVVRVIEAGTWREWRAMARAAHMNPIVLTNVQRMCLMRREHAEAGQRYDRWLGWCEMQRAIDELAQRGRLEALPRHELRRIVALQRRFGVGPADSCKHPVRPPRWDRVVDYDAAELEQELAAFRKDEPGV